MPIEKRTETVEKEVEREYYRCDGKECNNLLKWKSDANFLVMNPTDRSFDNMTAGMIDWDGVIILCDDCAEKAEVALSVITDDVFCRYEDLVLCGDDDESG